MDSKSIISENDGIVIKIRVQPNASKNLITGVMGDTLKVKIQSPPVEGAANKELIKYFSKVLGVSKSSIEIIQGEKSRNKTLKIKNLTQEEVHNTLFRNFKV